MNPLVRDLFRELQDLPSVAREQIFSERRIDPGIRAEVESLLAFDSSDEHAFTASVSSLVDDLIEQDGTASGSWGPFRQVRLLGTGGMGTVYLAERTDGEVRQQVAVKLLRADTQRAGWRDRFLKERQLLADLNHPSIARLIDAGHTRDERPYFVMEYVDGVPIDVYAKNKSLRDQLLLFLKVCDGVSHAHRQLIIHRDLKPSNILVDATGQPKLLDFGIAKLLDDTADRTQTMERLLTPNYASPEQIFGTKETMASDVYSLAAVLYKILTGRSPHESESGTSPAMHAMGTNEVLPPSRLNPDVPRDLDYIVRKALRPDAGERYGSVEALANDIRSLLEWRPVQARSGDTWYRTQKFLRRYWIPVAAVVALVAGLSLGLYEVNRERAIAQRRFEQVRQLGTKVLDLDKVVRAVPGAGSTKARHEIVTMTKEYLEALSAEPEAERDLALELGTAYMTLGEVQGVPSVSNLGLAEEADQSEIKADRFIDAVLTRSPLDRRALLSSAEISHNRMILADIAHRRDQILVHARKVTSRLESLFSAGQPTDEELNFSAVMFVNVALVHKNMHLYSDAVRYGRRTIEISRSLPSAPRHAAAALSIIADSLRYSGDPEGALKAIEEARGYLDKLDDPVTGNQAARFNVLWREGVILGEDGQINLDRTDDAIAVLQQAFDHVEVMVKGDPDDASNRLLFKSSGRELGDILRWRDPERALAVYDHALSRLGEIKSKNTQARLGEAELMASSSYALRRLHREGEANRRIDAAVALLRELKTYPADAITPDNETETVLRARADDLADARQFQAAADLYQELLDKVLASHPDPANDLRDATALSHIQEQLASLRFRLDQPEAARTLTAQRVELWQSWSARLPGNPFVRRQLEAATKH